MKILCIVPNFQLFDASERNICRSAEELKGVTEANVVHKGDGISIS